MLFDTASAAVILELPENAVLCPTQPRDNYCDCAVDCTGQPEWCSCDEAQNCCEEFLREEEWEESCEEPDEDGRFCTGICVGSRGCGGKWRL